MEFNKHNCECRTKTYLVKVRQTICYYPINCNCNRNDEEQCKCQRNCCNYKRKECSTNCWEKDFEAKYWNENNFNLNHSQENRNCCCKNNY